MIVPPAVEVLAARIRDTQARCGMKLCQVDDPVATSKYGPIVEVDVDYLAKDVLDALSAAGYVIVDPQDEETMRAAGFLPGLSVPPLDCTNNCMEGPCDCSGVNRVVAWKWLAPEEPLDQLTDDEFRTFAEGAGFDPDLDSTKEVKP